MFTNGTQRDPAFVFGGAFVDLPLGGCPLPVDPETARGDFRPLEAAELDIGMFDTPATVPW